MRMQQPHWFLNDPDAKMYGDKLQKALRHLPVKTTQKTLDFSALAICAFAMEAPRIGMSAQIAKATAAPPRAQAQVYPFAPAGPPNPTPRPRPQPVPPPAPSAQGQTHSDFIRQQNEKSQREIPEGFQQDGVDGPIGGVL